MKIELKSMVLRNFKKVRSEELEFFHNTLISGGNETGKSTVYDAYLWCLFGVTSRPDTTVQTLDGNNEIIHKLETSVTIVINFNDERDIKIERRLSERWKAKDTVEEKFLGTTQTRIIDEVPYSVTAFKEKLSSLCDYGDWFMLSNINLFWSYKIDIRRRILMSLAGEIDEKALMQDYPAVHHGVVDEHKDIADMLIQQKTTRKKANDELLMIPAKVHAQDALRVDDDFATIAKEASDINKQIADIDTMLQGVVTNTSEQKEYAAKLAIAKDAYNKARTTWQDNHYKKVDTLFKEVSAASEELRKSQAKVKEHKDLNVQDGVKLATLTEEFKNLTKQWKDVNEKEFNFTQTDVCPVCGRPYTDAMKEKEYENAVSEFNTCKAKQLAEIQNAASEKRIQIIVLKGRINTYKQVTSLGDENDLKEKQQAYNTLVKKRMDAQHETWEQSSAKVDADKDLQAIEATQPVVKIDSTLEENKQKKTQLSAKHDELIKRLSAQDTNERIEKEKKKLDARSRELAQVIADCNEVIRQIKAYKKAKISIVESKVNAYFSLIRWKFYEQNITNDDEKEICTAIDPNGVDYNNTNDGTVINMGIDIINGIAKAKDIHVPLFVDRKESVENALPSDQQTIYLQCKYGEPFRIENV